MEVIFSGPQCVKQVGRFIGFSIFTELILSLIPNASPAVLRQSDHLYIHVKYSTKI